MKPKKVIEVLERMQKINKQLKNNEGIQAIDHAITCVGAIEQIKWERDIAIQQLNELGYQFGEKKRTSTWLLTDAYPHRLYCHKCYKTTLFNFESLQNYNNDLNYCPYCASEMTNFDEVKGILKKYLNGEDVFFDEVGKKPSELEKIRSDEE